MMMMWCISGALAMLMNSIGMASGMEALVNVASATTVEEICRVTENPKLCVSCMGEHGVTAQATAGQVLQKHLEVTLSEIDKAATEAQELTNKDKGDPKRDVAFQACCENFQKADKEMKESLHWLAGNHITRLDSLLANALNHLEDCDDAFEDNNLEPLLEETTHQLERLIGNCQTLVRAMTT